MFLVIVASHYSVNGILTRFLRPGYVFNINRWLWCYDFSIKIDVFCGRNINWKLFNQGFKFFFSAKLVNWTSGWLFRNPHFLKQLTIVSSKTSPQADFIEEIAFKTSTSWIMSVAFTLLIIKITNFKSFLQYMSLKFLMVPASNGWSLEVVLFDVGISLT